MSDDESIVDDKEAFYDAEIAPVLLELSKKCQDEGLGFLAAVEFGKEEDDDGSIFGRTYSCVEDTTHEFRWFNEYVKAHGNLDAFLMGMIRWLRKEKLPHSSMYLQVLGLDANPEKR